MKELYSGFSTSEQDEEANEETDEDLPTSTKKKFLLSDMESEDEDSSWKRFSHPRMEGVKTLVYQIIGNIVDYATKSECYNLALLESEEEEKCTTFFIRKPPKCGSPIFALYFNRNERRVFMNWGFVFKNEVRMSNKPDALSLHLWRANANNGVFSLSETAYENNDIKAECTDKNEAEAKWFDADITISPTIIIDPDTAEPVRRKVYYDTEQKCMKAKILIIPQKSYFAFQIKHGDAVSLPLSDLKQGMFYRKGLHGFPKDLMEAARLLEKDGSEEALCELALLFKEPGSFNDPDSYKEYLLRSAEQGCEKAAIELSLGVAFGEISYKTLDECISLLKNIVTENSAEGNFVLAYLLENDSPQEAFDLFLKAAKNEYAPALLRLNCPEDFLEARSEDELYDFFITTHKENRGLLEYCMGCACFYGYDIEERKEVGIEILKNSAYLGGHDSEQLLLDIFDSEEGEFADKAKALFWLERIAAHDESVLVKLANRYLDGVGCEQSPENDKKAFAIFKSLEETDNKTAINNLAWSYKNGRGCPVDYIRARELFERSAGLGSSTSYYHLGTMYEEGLGTDINIDMAKKMYETAAENGHKKSKDRLENLQ